MSTNGTKIDLESRKKSNEKQVRSDYLSLLAYPINEKTLGELADLSAMLRTVGITLRIDRYEDTDYRSGYDIVTFRINEEKYQRITNRNAGRKPNFIAKYEKYRPCTVLELRSMLETKTKTETARILGCSRMTLYRILKNLKELKPEEDRSVWHYTSKL